MKVHDQIDVGRTAEAAIDEKRTMTGCVLGVNNDGKPESVVTERPARRRIHPAAGHTRDIPHADTHDDYTYE